jgi:hypothetical protein
MSTPQEAGDVHSFEAKVWSRFFYRSCSGLTLSHFLSASWLSLYNNAANRSESGSNLSNTHQSHINFLQLIARNCLLGKVKSLFCGVDSSFLDKNNGCCHSESPSSLSDVDRPPSNSLHFFSVQSCIQYNPDLSHSLKDDQPSCRASIVNNSLSSKVFPLNEQPLSTWRIEDRSGAKR